MRAFLRSFVFAVLSISGCGYVTPGFQGHPTTAHERHIQILVFENKSFRAGVEARLAASLSEELARRSNGVNMSSNTAQMDLSGKVLTYTLVPASYSAIDRIKEYRATVEIEATLKNTGGDKVYWKGELAMSQVFSANNDASIQQNTEDSAIREICKKLSQDLWQRIDQDF